MYSISEVAMPLLHQDHRGRAFARFMFLLRPWLRIAGSSFDIEETFRQHGLPTSRAGWREIDDDAKDLAMAWAEWFNAAATHYFKYPGTNVGATQMSANYFLFYPSKLYDRLQGLTAQQAAGMNCGIDVGGPHGLGCTQLLFAGSDVDLANGGVPWTIETVNASVRAAGLLGDGQNAIEVGTRRIFCRPEFFRFVKGEGAVNAASGRVPFIAAQTVNPRGMRLTYGTPSGTVVAGDTVTQEVTGATARVLAVQGTTLLWLDTITGTFIVGTFIAYDGGNGTAPGVGNTLSTDGGATTATIAAHSGDGITGSMILTGIAGGTFDNNDALVDATSGFNGDQNGASRAARITTTGGWQANLTVVPTLTSLTGAAQTILATDAVNPTFSPYRNAQFVAGSPIWNTFAQEDVSVGQWAAGGNIIAATPPVFDRSPPPVREKTTTKLAYGVRWFTGLLELANRDVITTVPATKTAPRTAARDHGLPSSVQGAVGIMVGGGLGRGTYDTGNGTKPERGEILSGPTGTARITFFSGDAVDGEISGEILSGFFDVGDAVTTPSGFQADLTLIWNDPANYRGPFLGPVQGDTETPRTKALAPQGANARTLSRLVLAAHRLYDVSGGLLEEIDALANPASGEHLRPSGLVSVDERHLFAMEVVAWMTQANINNARNPLVHPHDAGALSTFFGWPAALVGEAGSNVQALLQVDPKLHDRMLTEAIAVASGHPFRRVFAEPGPDMDLSTHGGQIRSGSIYLRNTAGSAAGATSLQVQVRIRVPALGANLEAGAFRIRLAQGAVFTAATFAAPAPDTTATATISGGGRVLTVEFEDATGYAAGDLLLLTATITPAPTGPYAGTSGRGAPVVVEVLGTWSDVSTAVNHASKFRGGQVAAFATALR